MPSPVAVELLAALCIAASGVLGACARNAAAGRAVSTAVVAIGAAIGLAALALASSASDAPLLVLGALPVGRIAVALDGLTALFLIPILVVSALGSVYGTTYWGAAAPSGRALRFWWGLMSASMMVVAMARDAVLFVLAWEAMALAAFFLIGTEGERREVRAAAWIYLVATHAGTLCLVAFFSLLAHAAGSTALWPVLRVDASGGLATALFALGVVGFGLKTGVVPLHFWLPGAHANAPSHVSGLLSGVLLKMGVYGIVRVAGLVPEPPFAWGAALLAIGVVSGLLGIALAVAQTDLKRLLAYSSIENVGLILIGVGLAALGRATGRDDLVALGLGGALLHVLNHALMKPLLFLTAGAVLHATGTRALSALGGLARTMPRSFALFTVGALAICGLPPLNGFASELLLYIGLLHTADAAADAGPVAWASLAAPALALIGAIAVAAFVEVAGIAFAGAPRSAAASHAHDPDAAMLAPTAVLAAGCVLLGVAPGAMAPLLASATRAWDPVSAASAPALWTLAPLGWTSVAALALLAAAALGAIGVRRRRIRSARSVTWDCGFAHPTARMQYVASSFSEILVGLFAWALAPRRALPDLEAPFPRSARFATDVPEPVLDRVLPAAARMDRGFHLVRALQRGPVHTYVLYVLAAVVVGLLIAR